MGCEFERHGDVQIIRCSRGDSSRKPTAEERKQAWDPKRHLFARRKGQTEDACMLCGQPESVHATRLQP